ncbi:MAG: F0F1 ATP synthase subunit B' [Paracoccaceae bacterium]
MASETTTTDSHAADAAGHGGESVGMPQLDFTSFPNQIFWLVVTLVVIYFVLSRVALPRIGSVLSDRQGAITNDIAAAEDLKQKAIEAEAAYELALSDARVEAGRIVAQAKADIQGELNVATAKADAEIAVKVAQSEVAIGEIRESAMKNVKVVAQDAAKEIVLAMGGKADAKSIAAAVDARTKG